MSEHEERCKKAVYALACMRGNGVIDLNRIQEILDPEREYQNG